MQLPPGPYKPIDWEPMGLFHMKGSGTVYPDSIVLEYESHIFKEEELLRQKRATSVLSFVAFWA
jgi:hypothetical protein